MKMYIKRSSNIKRNIYLYVRNIYLYSTAFLWVPYVIVRLMRGPEHVHMVNGKYRQVLCNYNLDPALYNERGAAAVFKSSGRDLLLFWLSEDNDMARHILPKDENPANEKAHILPSDLTSVQTCKLELIWKTLMK